MTGSPASDRAAALRVPSWAEHRDPQSLAGRYRRRRMKLFWESLSPGHELRILDVGGALETWDDVPAECHVTLVNLIPPERPSPPHCDFVQGDARDLAQFGDGEFDVAFSNSVIEHVGGPADQAAMAREVRRVGIDYFVQVPNLFFPIEPHFMFPGLQFAPSWARRLVARWWPFGWNPPGSPEAFHDADNIRLLSARELGHLFPEACILGERFGPLNKSLVAIRSSHLPSRAPGFRVLRSAGQRRRPGRGSAADPGAGGRRFVRPEISS